jgi:hypothetical protein
LEQQLPGAEGSTVVEASLLSVVQSANLIAKQAGFDRTCAKCNAPVGLGYNNAFA